MPSASTDALIKQDLSSKYFLNVTYRCNGRYRVHILKQGAESPKYYQTSYVDHQKYRCYGEISSVNDTDDDTLAYAKQAGEAAIIMFNGVKIKGDFVTSRKLSANIVVGFSQKAHASLKSLANVDIIECFVVFELKHSYFNHQHKALEALPNHVIQKIIPNERIRNSSIRSIKVPWCNLELDKSGQMQALTGILQQGSDPVIIIAGPFGTGKTRVLARAAYELIKQDRRSTILICTHHQHSADTFIEHFQSIKEKNRQFRKIKIVRIQTSQYHSRVKMKYRQYYHSAKEVSLLAPQIIVSTLGLSRHLNIKNITHILIDEAAQTRETEAIIPLQHAEPQTKIVLAGDHCQV